MNNLSKIIGAVAIGFAAGAVVGILLAPDKGSETIKTIRKQGIKVVDGFKDNLERVKEKVEDFKEEVANSVLEKYKEMV
jgi:gas vesicle protein